MGLTNTFNARTGLSGIVTRALGGLFNPDDAELIPFGVESIGLINGVQNATLKKYVSSAESNCSHSGMLIKFAPDYILITKRSPMQLYFLEVKASATPLWAGSVLNDIYARNPQKQIAISDIGLIAREAWNAYRTLYPNTIIVEGCTYNPKLLMAQFVSDVKCLRCYGGADNSGYDCTQCPLKTKSFFPVGINTNSTGSQKPHTNIDYSDFVEFGEFFGGLGVRVNGEKVEELKQKLMQTGLSLPDNIYPTVRNKIKQALINEGCDWLK